MSASKKEENSQGEPSKEALHCPTMGRLWYTVGMMCVTLALVQYLTYKDLLLACFSNSKPVCL